MSKSSRRSLRQALGDSMRSLAERVWPAPPPPQQELYPDDPRRLVERTLETPPGGPWDGFRSTAWTQRDLSPLSHDLMLAGGQFQWAMSPIVKRALEIQRDACVSQGWEIKATCEDEQERADTQEVIDAFWCDDTWDWELEIGNLFREAALSGELSLHHTDNPFNGEVHVGLISPEGIAQIEPNPLNASELLYVVLKQQAQVGIDSNGQPVLQDKFRIVHQNRRTKVLEGEVFHLRINGLSNASRGLSDLMPVLDWADQMHQLCHSEVDRAFLCKAFCFDVSIDGDANSKAMKDAKNRNQEPPRPGSVNFHSKAEEWKVLAPELNHAEFLELVKFIQGWVCACLGIPEHWLYEANTVNRASAQEMDDPVWLRIRERQRTVKSLVKKVFRYRLERAYFSRGCMLKDGRVFRVPPERATFDVCVKDPDKKNYPEAANAVSTLTDALMRATQGPLPFVSGLEAANEWRSKYNAIMGADLPAWTESDMARLATAPPAAPPAGTAATLPDGGGAYQEGRRSALGRSLGAPPARPALPPASSPSQECLDRIVWLAERRAAP